MIEAGVRYVVVDAKDSQELCTGDHIWLLEDGDLMCLEFAGWLPKGVVEDVLKRVDCSIDMEYYKRKREELIEQLKLIDAM